ncbi:MAG: CopG family transcriptional regulator [Cytophagales bacterium]|nr:CopG family transcriptional regulator [Cytophagales bacterium]
MKTMKIDLPKKIVVAMGNYVKTGWFNNESEVMRAALQEFIRNHRIELTDKFMEEDIKWALEIKKNRGK